MLVPILIEVYEINPASASQTHSIIEQPGLREKDRSVKSVAFSLGYKHPNDFTRAFIKNTGITPQEFRTSRTPGSRTF